MIRFSCPKCDTLLESTEKKAGSVISCPECKQRMQVPQASTKRQARRGDDDEDERRVMTSRKSTVKSTAPRRRDDDEDEDDDEEFEDERSSRAKGSKAGLLVIVGVAVVILASAGVAAYFALNNDKKDEAPASANNNPKPPAPPIQGGPSGPGGRGPGSNGPGGNGPGGPSNPSDSSGPGTKTPGDNGGDSSLTTLPGSGSSGANGEKIYDRLLKSAVWIATLERDGISMGSGSLIDRKNRIILTNYHVVGKHAEVIVFFPSYDNGKLLTSKKNYYLPRALAKDPPMGRVLARDEKRDLAIVQMAQVPPGVFGLHLAAESTRSGRTVHSIGSPGASDNAFEYTPGTVKGVGSKQWPAATGDGMVLNLDAWVVETTSPTNPGDSGGPLVNDRCELVGVTEGGSAKANSISYFIDIREVKDFVGTSLQKYGIKWEIESEDPPMAGPDSGDMTVDVPTLVKMLGSKDATQRAKAASGLASAGPRAQIAIHALLKALHDTDQLVSRAALEALQKIGKPARADVQLLITSLKDPLGEVRLYAAEALGLLGPDAAAAVESLIDATHDAENASVRHVAFQALGKVGARDHDKVLPVLLDAVKDPDRENRASALSGLLSLGPLAAEDVPVLSGHVKDAAPEARLYAIGALGKLGPQARDAVPVLIDSLAHAHGPTRCAAAESLGKIGADARSAAPKLLDALKGDDAALSSAAAAALPRMGALTKNDLSRITDLLKNDKPHIRISGIILLAGLDSAAKETIPLLGDALQDPDKGVRRQAALALGTFAPNSKEAIPKLIEAIKDTDNDVRKDAVRAITKYGKEASSATITLQQIIKDTQRDKELLGLTIVALGEIGQGASASLRDLRLTATEKDNRDLRDKIYQAMTKMGQKGVSELGMMLRDSNDAEIRLGAAKALGEIGPEVGKNRGVAAILVQHARLDQSKEVKGACLEAIKKISGG